MSQVIHYRFESAALPGVQLRVGSVRVVEALNEPYFAELWVAPDLPETDLKEMLGQNAALIMTRSGVERRVVGLVSEVQEATAHEQPRARVVLSPALALASLRRNTRMFQSKTTPEILELVLADALGPYERSAQLELSETYHPREYCLQYQETDLEFVHRLMEEEGIAYAFDHSGDPELMVLTDRNASFPLAPTRAPNGFVPFEPENRVARDLEPVHLFDLSVRDTTTSVTVRDFDWSKGDYVLHEEAAGEDARGRVRESYEHGIARELRIGSYDEGARRYQQHDGARQASTRLEASTVGATVARGVSRVVGFAPGLRFELNGHPTLGVDGEYLLTRVEHHRASAEGTVLPAGEGGQVEEYHNRFECIPAATVYRPRRSTRRPRVDGVETALVTGPAGEEIHVDHHGRIKVQFHWDRENPADETSSCWVRVKQEWAGPGWGFWWAPRIGMEVLVHFVDGDPDRPLVTGCVYDAANPTPYPLPDEKTKSTIKSNSSLGGGGSNELRFEDRAGSEEIYTHAQKDYNEVVEHDHDTLVHHDQKNTVDGNQTQTVHGNQTERVDVDQTMTIGGDRTVHVEGDFDETVDGTETRHVVGDVTETFDASETRSIGASVTETIGGNETRTVGASQTETIGGSHTLTIGGSSSLTVAGSLTESVTGGITTITPGSFSASAGGGWTLTATGGITIIAPAGATIIAPGGTGRVDWQWNTTAGAESADAGAFQFEFYAAKFELVGTAIDFCGFRMTDNATDISKQALRGGIRTLRARVAAFRNRKAVADVEPAQNIEA